MGDDEHRHVLVTADVLQQLQDLLAGLIVERAGRLVAQQQLRLLGDCARNGHALLFAAGQLRREIAQPVAQADLVQGVGRVEMVGADLRREFDVLQCGQIRHEIVELEDESDVHPPVGYEVAFAQSGDVAAADDHAPGGGGVHAAKDVQRRGLARARLPEDHRQFASVGGETGLVQCADRGAPGRVFLDHAVELDIRHHAPPRTRNRCYTQVKQHYVGFATNSRIAECRAGIRRREAIRGKDQPWPRN